MSPFQGCRITEQIRVKSPKTEDIKNFKVTISIGFRAFDLGTTLTEKPLSECTERGFEWCHRDSNQGHKDFQSFALPTEL